MLRHFKKKICVEYSKKHGLVLHVQYATHKIHVRTWPSSYIVRQARNDLGSNYQHGTWFLFILKNMAL